MHEQPNTLYSTGPCTYIDNILIVCDDLSDPPNGYVLVTQWYRSKWHS